MAETIKLKSPKTETELINILRWEEDGGTMIEINYSTPDRHLVQPMLQMEKYVTHPEMSSL
jgi:hypothetical protein